MSGLHFQLLGYHETPTRVRFGEVDHYGYLWHGHALAHFEAARADLARQHKVTTADLLGERLTVPMVDLSCEYKKSAYEDEELVIQSTLLKPSLPLPMLQFVYRIIKKSSREDVTWGRTRQVCMYADGRITTRMPDVIQTRLKGMWQHLSECPRWENGREVVGPNIQLSADVAL